MATRKPPTAGELADLLEQFLTTPPEGSPLYGAVAAPYESFLRHVQNKLRTTTRNARLWLQNVAVADNAPFRLMRTSHGSFVRQLRSNSDPNGLHLYEFAYWGGLEGFYYEAQPRLNIYGVPIDSRLNRAEEARFFIATAALNDMIIATSARHDEIKAETARSKAAGLDAADAAHGEGIALLRGLLHSAGIHRQEPWFEIRYDEKFAHENPMVDMTTHVTINLYGLQLDALAPVLRELGVKPRTRKNVTTEEKPAEASPADA